MTEPHPPAPPASFDERGFELRGIERVPPTERTDANIFSNFTLWLSANLVISTVALGALGRTLFGLGFNDAVLAVLLFNVIAVLPVAFFSTLGPRLGLRQMTITRFSFGWVGAIFIAALNVAACIGWSAVNVIVGGQLVAALSDGHVPTWAGIAIIAALTTVVSIYGYRLVHGYERFAWIPMAAVFLLVGWTAWPAMRSVPTPPLDAAEVAAFLSFGGAVYGFATGWSSYAADYNVNQPEDVPAARVFWLTFVGVYVPCVALEILGLGLTTVPSLAGLNGGVLLAAAVQPLGGYATPVLLLMAFSVVANNIPNDYSLGLSIQVFGSRFQRVPRHVWTLIGSVLYVALAIPAAANYSETLTDFLLLIGYWLAPWSTIVALEHIVIRRGQYDAHNWNHRAQLPSGWAALLSMAFGGLGVWLGAAQAWHVGPLARLIGPRGADIGFELAVLFAATAFLLLRPMERRSDDRATRIGAEEEPPPPSAILSQHV